MKQNDAVAVENEQLKNPLQQNKVYKNKMRRLKDKNNILRTEVHAY